MTDVIDKKNLIDQIDALTVDGDFSQQDVNYLVNYLLANGDMTGTPRDLIQIRRGLEENLPNLGQGELAVTLDTERIYVGGMNGNIPMLSKNDLPYKMIGSFGAKGDGVKNDTQAFKDAFNSLEDGETLYVSHGTYLISVNQLVLMKNNVRIVGCGTLKSTTENGGYLLRIMSSNVIVDGLTFETGYASNQINESANPITCVNIETPDNGAIISNITIQNCLIRNATAYGIGVTENSFNHSIKNSIHNMSILNNRVYAAIIGIEVFPKAVSKNLIVDGNYVEVIGTTSSGETDAMKPCQMYRNAVVTNNIMVGGKTTTCAIGLFNEELLFSNNVLLTSSGSALGINLMPHVTLQGFVPVLKDIKIENNIFVAQRYGLVVNGQQNFDDMIISNNIVKGTEGSVMMSNVDGANGTLKGVTYLDNLFSGIFRVRRSDDTTKKVSNVTIKGGSIFPQLDIQYADDILIDGVVFKDSNTFAVNLANCQNVRFVNSHVIKPFDLGMSVVNCSDVVIKDNLFKNCNSGNNSGANCINFNGIGDSVYVDGNLFVNEVGKGYAVRALSIVSGYTDVYVLLNNIYKNMISSSSVTFDGLVFAGMEKGNRILYANQIPSTQYPSETFVNLDKALNMLPQELGTAPNKYIVDGWVYVDGSWKEKRVLTGN